MCVILSHSDDGNTANTRSSERERGSHEDLDTIASNEANHIPFHLNDGLYLLESGIAPTLTNDGIGCIGVDEQLLEDIFFLDDEEDPVSLLLK